MSEPTVVGIPIGGAVGEQVGERVGGSTSAIGKPIPGTQRALPNAPATDADQPREDLPDLADAAHIASTAVPSPPPAADTAQPPDGSPARQAFPSPPPPSAPVPIFHVIGAPASLERPVIAAPESPTLESHLEVGVQGRARACVSSPPKPAGVPAEVEVRHPGRALAVASVAALVVGSGFLIRALTLADPVPPPVPPAWAGRVVGAVGHRAAPLGYARPTRVTIARVGIHADVLALGPTRDGGVGVPPVKEPLTAAWYDRGPAPGQTGPAVITGHVDSRFAPGHRAAFYELGAVRPGDDVDVTRADQRVAVFRVDSVALVPKAGFPTSEVYGPTRYAALRLITCGGHYDRRTGYADNVIVYAHLVGSR
jgi:hypothetical protein